MLSYFYYKKIVGRVGRLTSRRNWGVVGPSGQQLLQLRVVGRLTSRRSALGRRKMHPKASNFLALPKPDHAAVLDLS